MVLEVVDIYDTSAQLMMPDYTFAAELYWKMLNKFFVKNCLGMGNNH